MFVHNAHTFQLTFDKMFFYFFLIQDLL